MKTYLATSNGRLAKWIFGVGAAAAMAFAAIPCHAASSFDPTGDWNCLSSGSGQNGITLISFFDDGTGTNRTFTGFSLVAGFKKGPNQGGSADGRPGNSGN